MTKHIGFLVYPTFDLLDLSGPLEVFQWAERLAPGNYTYTVMALGGGAVPSAAGMSVNAEAALEVGLDTLIVAGGGSVMTAPCPSLVAFVRRARHVRRMASVCTGAFVLAAAGLLDGRPATTHWRWTDRLGEMYPGVRVDHDRIFVRDDGLWTSAGITAGIDMSLAMVEEDAGRDVAGEVARMLVVYYRRPGGQTQYSSLLEHEPDSDRIHRALGFAREHLGEPLSVERLAEVACLSVRQFSRAFLAATGTTPAKAIERLRAETARPRVEGSRETLDAIARDIGFPDPARMRAAFVRRFGRSPSTMRRLAHEARAATDPGATAVTHRSPDTP